MYEAADIKIITSKMCAADVLFRDFKKPFLKQKVDIAMLDRIEATAINEKLGASEVIDMMAKLNIKNSDIDRDIGNIARGMTLISTLTSND